MNRLDRLQAILIQLQSKKVVKAQEIADRFEVSLRTVYRDIRSLEESGVPIGAEAGVGYFLQDSFNLPPIMFTHEEASALIFGEKLIENMSDARVNQDFNSAIYKIKAILHPEEKDLFEKLNSHITVFNSSKVENKSVSLHLYEIQHAIANKLRLKIDYEAKNSEPTSREIEPVGLCNYASQWHIIAWCCLRSDYRDFRVDRIKTLEVTEKSFKNKKHISLDEYMQSMVPNIEDEPNISILVDTDKHKYIYESKFWYGYIKEEKVNDKIRMYFYNTEFKGFAAWLLNTGSYPTIEKPSELLETIHFFIEQASKKYLSTKQPIL